MSVKFKKEKPEPGIKLCKATISYSVLFTTEDEDLSKDARLAIQADLREHRLGHFMADFGQIDISQVKSHNDIPERLKGTLPWLTPEDHPNNGWLVEEYVEEDF